MPDDRMNGPVELERSGAPFDLPPDARPRMPEPPPVRLVAIADVRLPASAGLETELDAFYIGLLRFEREGVAAAHKPRLANPLLGPSPIGGATPPPLALGLRNREEPAARGAAVDRAGDFSDAAGPIYRADNFRILFGVFEGPVPRERLRIQGIGVPSLAEAEARLIEAEFDYVRQRGLTPGMESLLLRDPAGNWVEIVEMKEI